MRCISGVPPKEELRQEMKARLRSLNPRARALASEKICRVIDKDPAWQSARVVGAFLPIPGEPRISHLWARPGERQICLPRVRGVKLDLVPLPHADLLVFADWQLTGTDFDSLPSIDPAQIDLLLVPGLAFTKAGGRLGRGGGHYDRLLAGLATHTRTIGVCFTTQLVDGLPMEAHDRPVERVITETDAG
jgi:5-formyltetrahydrofolate cyclo-ligase